MIIRLNGVENKLDLPSQPTIQALVAKEFPTLSAFAVAVNEQIVPRSEFARFQINEGDHIEIIQAVGGG